MSNILEAVTAQRNTADIRSALREIGCDVSNIDSMDDIAQVIREQCVTGPNAVINAKLASGPGIKITPIDRKGYKISANSGATIIGDLSDDLPAGTTLHKVLFHIINKMIPDAVKQATNTPGIVSVEIFKAPYDGVDFYDNKAFGAKGHGRRSGLHPDEWYLKIYLFAQIVPIYVSFGALMEDFRKQLMCEVHHMVDNMIRDAFDKYMNQCPPDRPRPDRPHCPDRPRPDRPHCPDRPEGPWDPDCCPHCNEPGNHIKPSAKPICSDSINIMYDTVVNKDELAKRPAPEGVPVPGAVNISSTDIENMFDDTVTDSCPADSAQQNASDDSLESLLGSLN